MALGDRLKELRLKNGHSLQQVADAIGASKAHIWELEANRSTNPSLEMLQKLASHFDTTVAYLIDEPEGELTKADQFFRRNSNKLANLTDEDFKIFESLLNRIADSERK